MRMPGLVTGFSLVTTAGMQPGTRSEDSHSTIPTNRSEIDGGYVRTRLPEVPGSTTHAHRTPQT